MKAVAYCRYSSENQRDGYSIEAQVSAIRAFCEKEKIELIKFYIDEAASATKDNRDAFQDMISDSKKGEWDYVIVHKLDRFARNRYDSALYKKVLLDNNVKVLSVLEHLDDSPESVIMEGLLEAMAEYYSKNLAREVKKGLDERAKKFVSVNGSVPYGYRLVNDQYEIVPDQALIIKELYERIAKGETPNVVVLDIASRGVKTKRGNSFNKIKPLKLLSNPIYKGAFKHVDDELVEGVIPAIVSKDLWNEVNQLHLKNIDSFGKPFREAQARKKEGFYLLTGYLYCGICGKHFVGHKSTLININNTSSSKPKYINYHYRCATKANAKTIKSCTAKLIKKELLEDFTQRLIEACIFSDDTLDTIVTTLEDLVNQKRVPISDLKAIKKKISELKKKESRLLDIFLSGSIDKDTYNQKAQEIRTAILSLEAELNKATSIEYFPKDKIKSTLLEVLNEHKNDDTYRLHLFKTFLEKIVVYEDRLEYTFKLPILKGSKTAVFDKNEIVRKGSSTKDVVLLRTIVSYLDFKHNTLIFTHPEVNLFLNQRI